MHKDIRKIVKEAQKNGWILERGGKHYKLRKPGRRPIAVPISPSDHRAPKNLKKEIEREDKLAAE